MMNKTRFFFMAAVLFAVCTFSAFAYDGTVFACDYVGQYSRYEFISEANSDEWGDTFIREATSAHSRVDKFFLIDEDSCDEEDVDIIQNLPSYLTKNFRVTDGSAYTTGIWRGDTNTGKDGWLVVSHYNNSKGWLHYMYYFSISYF